MTPELDILVKVTVVLVLGLVATRLAARARASVRHLLLSSTLGALVALPMAAAIVPDLVVFVRMSQSTAPGVSADTGATLETPARSAGLVSSAARSLDGAGAAIEGSTGISIPAAFRLVWASGALLLLAFLAHALWRVRAVGRSGIPWLAGQTTAEALARDLGIRRRLTVILHEDVPAPVTCGWRNPTIVLPIDARDWRESDLQRAFVHELEHVRRGDWPLHLVARAVCAGYWFHPLVWFAWRRLCLESERACDDAVVGREERTDYAEQLVTLARRLTRSHAQPVLSMASRSDLSVRVKAVLDGTQLRGRAGASLVAATVAAASVFVLVLAPVRVEAVPDPQVRNNQVTTNRSPRINASARALNAALLEAATEGDVGEVIALLDDGADVNAVVRGDGTALLVAAREGDRELVDFLLQRGADVDLGAAGDGTPLIMAAREGYLEIVSTLLDRGADPDAAVAGDGNALIMAAREGYPEIVRTLLDRGADPNAAVAGDGNALITAAREGHLDIVTVLLDRGAGIEEVVPGDENALIGASGSGHLDVVRLLVSRGANINARVWAEQGWFVPGGEWRTPLSIARRGEHAAVVRYLQSLGATD
jgi:ankyrin repeat protein/beta-lactamase regulating signal transducer with metallopeptidase domain